MCPVSNMSSIYSSSALALANSSSGIKIPTYNNKNFIIWESRIKAHLRAVNAIKAIEEDTSLEEMTSDDVSAHHIAKGVIIEHVNDLLMLTLNTFTRAYEMLYANAHDRLLPYLAPVQNIKAMSGLSTRGDFYIPRAQIIPPLELQKKIFPTLDYWLARYNGQTHIDSRIEQPMTASEAPSFLQTSIAGHGFLKLAEYLREVFLQDILFLRKEYPDLHFLWDNEFFADPNFVELEQNFWRLYSEKDSDGLVPRRIEAVIPEVATSIASLHHGLATKMDEVLGSVTQGVLQLQEAILRGHQETRELASRVAVMESGFKPHRPRCVFSQFCSCNCELVVPSASAHSPHH
ncbi:hypothetical protein V1525DRAFT_439712 [Lipomyces kononenkoae]|uniref:Uncharacterized protein n=1 Tax=Lipomyces kononenkoae TaxID=34357 RepID=A0ACC3T435_LIPKO